jgi:hypothetical protein
VAQVEEQLPGKCAAARSSTNRTKRTKRCHERVGSYLSELLFKQQAVFLM